MQSKISDLAMSAPVGPSPDVSLMGDGELRISYSNPDETTCNSVGPSADVGLMGYGDSKIDLPPPSIVPNWNLGTQVASFCDSFRSVWARLAVRIHIWDLLSLTSHRLNLLRVITASS